MGYPTKAARDYHELCHWGALTDRIDPYAAEAARNKTFSITQGLRRAMGGNGIPLDADTQPATGQREEL